MKTLKFNTNINCGGCIKAVTPTLNGAKEIQNWRVDTAVPEKTLTVTGEVTEEQVVELLKEIGFEAQPA